MTTTDRPPGGTTAPAPDGRQRDQPTAAARPVFLVGGAALALGLLGDVLLRATPWGLNAFLWAAALATTLAAAPPPDDAAPPAARRPAALLALPALLAAAGLAWRDSPTLKALDFLALLVALSFLALRSSQPFARPRRTLRRPGIVDYALTPLTAGMHALFGAAPLLLTDIPWRTLAHRHGRDQLGWERQAAAVGRGLAIAVPLLLLFGGLLATADAIFAGLVADAFGWDVGALVGHLVLALALAWVAAGLLRATAHGEAALGPTPERPAAIALGPIEVGVVLGLLDALFLLFVAIQFRYLFGGAERVEASTDLTYAQYARRGFFELVAVAALALSLLLLAHWLLRPRQGAAAGRSTALFRVLAGTQIALLVVMLASALERMRLYQREYGLTELRLYTTAFMGWLAVVLLWFTLTVLRDRRDRFATGALLAGGLVLLALHALNPDATIVRANAGRIDDAALHQPFDASYATTLSADAVPALLETLPRLRPEVRCQVAVRLLDRWLPPPDPDWRTWARSRAAAFGALRDHESELRAMACPQRTESAS